VYNLNPSKEKVLNGEGGTYTCADSVHVFLTGGSATGSWTAAATAGTLTSTITDWDFTAASNQAALVTETWVVTRCAVANTSTACDGANMAQDDNLVITVGCQPNDIVLDIGVSHYRLVADGSSTAWSGGLLLDSFPTTCYGFYDSTHNLDGYTYHCDLCEYIPWITYTAPVGDASHTKDMTEGMAVDASIAVNYVGTEYVITRTYSKNLSSSTVPADSFSDTITLRYTGAAMTGNQFSDACPDNIRFKEDPWVAYYGTTKVLKYDEAYNWTLDIEDGIESTIYDHANACGATALIEISPDDGSGCVD
jgi:hypothetical protein